MSQAASSDISVTWSNPDALEEHEQAQREARVERRQRQREYHGIKQQLQQDREQHTFYVEWYNGTELPFNPLPKEASDEIAAKRERMTYCAQNGQWDEFLEQAEVIAENVAEWLAEAWDGDEPMTAQDWQDIYDTDELMELLNKVDQRGGGAETEAVLEFLGG